MDLYKSHFIVSICMLSFLVLVKMETIMPQRCEFLKEADELLERKCKGTFPKLAATKFQDTFITTGEPIAIYMVPSLKYVALMLKKSPLLDCQNLKFLNVDTFHCLDGYGGNLTITLSKVDMHCFPFHIQMPDDILKECLEENEMGMGIMSDVLRTQMGVIHYSFDADWAPEGLKPNTAGLIILVWVVIASRKFIFF